MDSIILNGQSLNGQSVAVKIEEAGEKLHDLADQVSSQVEGVSFAGQFWYETEVAFKNQYKEKIDAIVTRRSAEEGDRLPRGEGWSGESISEGVKNAANWVREARAQTERDGSVPSGGQPGAETQAGTRGTGNGSGKYSSGGLAPLEGGPVRGEDTSPDTKLVRVAEQYAADNGIDLKRQSEYAQVDPARATRIADAYAEMKHDPQDPVVAEAYQNMIKQTRAQYQALVDAGYEFYFYDNTNDPYAGNPWNAMRDLRANQRMGVYSTEAGFGSGDTAGTVDQNVSNNPLLEDTGLVWMFDGKPRKVLANDLFRAVHDAFGHGLEGVGFRAAGEENAWQAHVRLFTGSAVAALTSETRGQNSWTNFGPHGEHNRTAKVEDTIFADQKTGLLPEFALTEGLVGDQQIAPEVRPTNLLRQVKPTFFSALSREIGGLSKIANKQGEVKVDQAKAWIAARQQEGKFKKEEVEAIGLMEWLDLRKDVAGSVRVADIQNFVEENGVQVEDVLLGDSGSPYRDVASFMDEAFDQIKEEDPEYPEYIPDHADVLYLATDKHERYHENAEYHNEMDTTAFSDYQLPGGTDYRELLLTLPGQGREFTGRHYDQANILAHVRFNTRTNSAGVRTLFIEEIQSDWAQTGRKEGFANVDELNRLEGELQKARAAYDAEAAMIAAMSTEDRRGNPFTKLQELAQSRADANDAYMKERGEGRAIKIPSAPFVQDTKSWTALTMKRMLRYAAENGFDKIAWTTGAQQVERWARELRKEVDVIEWTKTPKGVQIVGYHSRKEVVNTVEKEDALSDSIGKIMANKIKNDPNQTGTIEGDEITISDTGMAGFYDKMVPQVANSILRSLGGGKVTTEHIGLWDMPDDSATEVGQQPTITITPELRAKIMQGLPLFQPVQGQDEARGGFDPTTLTTILGTEADNSTFLHETAHFFLSVYADMAANPNATEQSKQDMQTVLDWFGVKDLATWNQMSLDEQRKYHEQFAYNYEIYLFEGKAPNIKLQTIFDRFSAWLARVYKSIRDDLNAIYRQEHGTDLPILTGEVRQVMDRMLATSEQIKQTETVRNMVPIFQTQEQSGMDDSEWAAYQEMSQEATNAAIGEMQTASLRQMKWLSGARSRVLKEMQKETAEIRKSLRDKVVEEVKADPVYRAINGLKTGETTDQNGNDIKADAGYKLSIAAVEAMYPESDTALYQGPDLKKLGRGKQKGMLSEDGLHPDLVAEMFGFKSGD